jgi:thioredoxin 1
MKTSPFLIIFVLIFCSPVTGEVPDSAKYQSLLPYDFHLTYLREARAILIDVREFFEFRKTRLKDAVNIPSSGNLEFSTDTIDHQYSLFFYCTTGYRSKRVAEFFHEKGFRHLYSLDGGIMAWKKDGFPVERKKVRRRE